MEPEVVTDSVNTLRRKKRTDVSEAWCCKIPRPEQTIKEPFVSIYLFRPR